MKHAQEQIDAVAEAILNARGRRRGMPPVSNLLAALPEKLVAEAREDAEAALDAAREWKDRALVGFTREVLDDPEVDAATLALAGALFRGRQRRGEPPVKVVDAAGR